MIVKQVRYYKTNQGNLVPLTDYGYYTLDNSGNQKRIFPRGIREQEKQNEKESQDLQCCACKMGADCNFSEHDAAEALNILAHSIISDPQKADFYRLVLANKYLDSLMERN